MIFNDQVAIIPIAENLETGERSQETPFLSKAYIEELSPTESSTEATEKGKERKPEMLVMLPIDISIRRGDTIRATKLKGISLIDALVVVADDGSDYDLIVTAEDGLDYELLFVDDDSNKEHIVISAYRVGGITAHHWEVKA